MITERSPVKINTISFKEWITATLSVTVTGTTAQKMKFSIKDFYSKCDQIRSFLPIWSDLLKKSLMKNLIFCAVYPASKNRWLQLE